VQGGWANYTVPERTRYPLPFDGTNQQPSKLGKASFITLRFVLSLSGQIIIIVHDNDDIIVKTHKKRSLSLQGWRGRRSRSMRHASTATPSTVQKSPCFEPYLYRSDQVTKTRSGRAWRKSRTQGVFFCRSL
jgi:hypothetical protein